MKGGYTRLFDDAASGDRVSEYADAHSTPLPDFITAYHASASEKRDDSEMLSSNFQSKMHLFLARAIGAKRGEFSFCLFRCPQLHRPLSSRTVSRLN